MYNKLFTKILDSSIWLEPMPTRIVWLTMIAAMDDDGMVQFASVANLAHRARVSELEASEAVRTLESPDRNSSDHDHEGRRIERVPGGWIVLNANKYRELVSRVVAKEKTRIRVAKFRETKRARDAGGNAPVTHGSAPETPTSRSVTPSETDTAAATPTSSTPALGGGEVVVVASGEAPNPPPSPSEPVGTQSGAQNAPTGRPSPENGLPEAGVKPELPDVVQFWNSHPELPKVKSMSPGRKTALRARMRDEFWQANFRAAVGKVLLSSFCMGESERGWRADFDWMLRPDSVAKLMEGKYDNRAGGGAPRPPVTVRPNASPYRRNEPQLQARHL